MNILYSMADGSAYYSECGQFILSPHDCGEVLHLDAAKSLKIKNITPVGGFEAARIDTFFGKPSYIEHPLRMIVGLQECTDEQFISKCRVALAGLIIPSDDMSHN